MEQDAAVLLATLPEEAGGVIFEYVQSVDGAFLSGHPVDDVLAALDKPRSEAVAVFRSESNGEVGATTVDGVDGSTLLKAFADAWRAPGVIGRFTRVLGGTVGWELRDRGGDRTVVYQRGDVVYLVSAHDEVTLDGMLADMPRPQR